MKTNFVLNNKNIDIRYNFQSQIFEIPTCQENILDDVCTVSRRIF